MVINVKLEIWVIIVITQTSLLILIPTFVYLALTAFFLEDMRDIWWIILSDLTFYHFVDQEIHGWPFLRQSGDNCVQATHSFQEIKLCRIIINMNWLMEQFFFFFLDDGRIRSCDPSYAHWVSVHTYFGRKVYIR